MWYINDMWNINEIQKKNKFSLVKISLSSISSKLLNCFVPICEGTYHVFIRFKIFAKF